MIKKVIGIILLEVFLLLGILMVFLQLERPTQRNILARIKTETGTIGMAQGILQQYLFYDRKIESTDPDNNPHKAYISVIQEQEQLEKYKATDFDECQNEVYVLLKNIDNNSDYLVAKYDDQLRLKQIYSMSGLENTRVNAMSVYNKKIYITCIENQAKTAIVYCYDVSSSLLLDVPVRYELDRMTMEEGQYIVDADYDGTNINCVKQDDDITMIDTIHGFDTNAQFSDKRVIKTLFMKYAMTIFLISIFVWGIIASILVMNFSLKSYGVQKFALIESLIMLMSFAMFGLMVWYANSRAEEIREKNAGYLIKSLQTKLGSYLLSEEDEEGVIFNSLFDTVAYYQDGLEETDFFESINLVSIENERYQIDLSTKYPRNYTVQSVLGEQAKSEIQQAKTKMKNIYGEVNVNGRKCGITVNTWDSELIPKHFIVSVVPLDQVRMDTKSQVIFSLIASVVLLVIGTFMNFFISYYEFVEIRKFSITIENMCQGRSVEIMKPETRNWDMETMWNSLAEIYKDREKMFYARDRIFQAYYRFAPRNIEKILGSDAVSEIKAGDMVEVDATIGMIFNKEKGKHENSQYVKDINHNYEIIGRNQLKYDGVLIANGSDLSAMNALFIKENANKRAIRFAIDSMLELSDQGAFKHQNISLLLHNQKIIYGVAGSAEQTFPFIISDEMNELKKFGILFREKGIRLVITKDIEEVLDPGIERKYIGFINMKSMNKKVDCYEVIDAYPINEKNEKRRAYAHFEEGLKLFYQNDYYLARNEFSESFKICEKDELALWYIFQCEKLLALEDMRRITHSLFEEI